MSSLTLGTIAGTGDLPRRLIMACRSSGRPFFVLAFENQTEPAVVDNVPHAWVRLGAAGKALKLLRKNEVDTLVLAGPFAAPSLSELRPDFWVTKFLARRGKAILDDEAGLIGAVIRELEEKEGFAVETASDILSDPAVQPRIFAESAGK